MDSGMTEENRLLLELFNVRFGELRRELLSLNPAVCDDRLNGDGPAIARMNSIAERLRRIRDLNLPTTEPSPLTYAEHRELLERALAILNEPDREEN